MCNSAFHRASPTLCQPSASHFFPSCIVSSRQRRTLTSLGRRRGPSAPHSHPLLSACATDHSRKVLFSEINVTERQIHSTHGNCSPVVGAVCGSVPQPTPLFSPMSSFPPKTHRTSDSHFLLPAPMLLLATTGTHFICVCICVYAYVYQASNSGPCTVPLS